MTSSPDGPFSWETIFRLHQEELAQRQAGASFIPAIGALGINRVKKLVPQQSRGPGELQADTPDSRIVKMVTGEDVHGPFDPDTSLFEGVISVGAGRHDPFQRVGRRGISGVSLGQGQEPSVVTQRSRNKSSVKQ
jgi:hypothetical protein